MGLKMAVTLIKKIAMASRKKSKKDNDTYVKISIDRDDGLS